MPLVALGPFTRQVDTSTTGGMTLTIPAAQPGDLLVAVAFRHTQQFNSGRFMTWVDPTGWFPVAELGNRLGVGAGRSPWAYLAAWVTLAPPAGPTVDIEWSMNDNIDDGRIGDIGVVAVYRPGPPTQTVVASLGHQTVTFTNPDSGTSPEWSWTAPIPTVALCASGLSGRTGPYSSVDMAGFTLRGSSVDTEFRPELHISDITVGSGTHPGPRWAGARGHTQLIVGNIPLPRRGGLNLGLVRGRRGVG